MKIPALPTVKLLGDPHLGKRFRTGVPLHRRGEREHLQWEKFLNHINDVKRGDTHVCMGDLFDDYVVDNLTVWNAAHHYREAAEANPDVFYIVHIGNHDASKDIDKISSFAIFAKLVSGIPNLKVVQDIPYFHTPTKTWHLPWTPFNSSREVASWIDKPCVAAFGHWDHRDFGDENHTNVVPQIELSKWTDVFVTGHEHTPGVFKLDKGTLYITGSMEPYSHGEDPDELIYVTRQLEDVDDISLYEHKALRLIVPPGGVVPEGWSDVPLQFQCIYERADVISETEVKADFSFENGLSDILTEFGVSENLSDKLLELYKASRKEQ